MQHTQELALETKRVSGRYSCTIRHGRTLALRYSHVPFFLFRLRAASPIFVFHPLRESNAACGMAPFCGRVRFATYCVIDLLCMLCDLTGGQKPLAAIPSRSYAATSLVWWLLCCKSAPAQKAIASGGKIHVFSLYKTRIRLLFSAFL